MEFLTVRLQSPEVGEVFALRTLIDGRVELEVNLVEAVCHVEFEGSVLAYCDAVAKARWELQIE